MNKTTLKQYMADIDKSISADDKISDDNSKIIEKYLKKGDLTQSLLLSLIDKLSKNGDLFKGMMGDIEGINKPSVLNSTLLSILGFISDDDSSDIYKYLPKKLALKIKDETDSLERYIKKEYRRLLQLCYTDRSNNISMDTRWNYANFKKWYIDYHKKHNSLGNNLRKYHLMYNKVVCNVINPKITIFSDSTAYIIPGDIYKLINLIEDTEGSNKKIRLIFDLLDILLNEKDRSFEALDNKVKDKLIDKYINKLKELDLKKIALNYKNIKNSRRVT